MVGAGTGQAGPEAHCGPTLAAARSPHHRWQRFLLHGAQPQQFLLQGGGFPEGAPMGAGDDLPSRLRPEALTGLHIGEG